MTANLVLGPIRQLKAKYNYTVITKIWQRSTERGGR